MAASIEWKWKNDLIYVWKNRKTAQFKNVSRVTTYFIQHFKGISSFEKNHALLILHPISFMLRQTFRYYFVINRVYISHDRTTNDNI